MRRIMILLVAGLMASGSAAASAPERPAPSEAGLGAITALEPVLRTERQLARDFGTCFIKCAERFQTCMAAAADTAAARSCRLKRSACDSFCGKFTR